MHPKKNLPSKKEQLHWNLRKQLLFIIIKKEFLIFRIFKIPKEKITFTSEKGIIPRRKKKVPKK